MQVQVLRKSAESMKEQLGAHQNCLTDSVEEYSAGLREKRDQLDSTWRSTCRELQMCTATEVITKHKALDQKIVPVHPCDYSPEPQLPKIMLVKTSRVIGKIRIGSGTLFLRSRKRDGNIVCRSVGLLPLIQDFYSPHLFCWTMFQKMVTSIELI